MQTEIISDLHDTGLLHYAESWGVLSDVNKLLKGPGAAEQAVAGKLGGYLQGSTLPAEVVKTEPGLDNQHATGSAFQEQQLQQQHDDEPMQQQGSSGCVDEVTRQANCAADAAAAAASQAVLQARTIMQEVTVSTATRLAPMGSTTQQSEKPAGRATRKGRAAASTATAQAQAGGGPVANNKGLRQFAMKVCEKVRERGRTTYNEVADLLVTELSQVCDLEGKEVPDDKTIRRRVYDAINVLMALEIIEREKKDIIWKGMPGMGGALGPLPGGPEWPAQPPAGPMQGLPAQAAGPAGTQQQQPQQEVDLMGLRQERLQRISEVDRKQCYLQELVDQHAALKQLIHRNASQGQRGGTEIHLPFILIQARPDATVEVQISDDMQDVTFDIYNSAIQIHDDSGVIKQMVAAAAAPTKPDTPRSMQS